MRFWPRRKAHEHRWPCIQPECTAEALPRGGKLPGSPFCPDHGWDTYHAYLGERRLRNDLPTDARGREHRGERA